MLGFYGVINGRTVNNAIDFIIEARREDGEKVPKEALAEIMNRLTQEQIENNLFTKKEIKLLRNIEDYEKTKFYSLKRISDDFYDEDDDFDDLEN